VYFTSHLQKYSQLQSRGLCCTRENLTALALERAGIDTPHKGAHQFRHGLACDLLRQGASLAEIGELLRHRHPETTAIYAKIDLAALRTLGLAWPGGMQ
jgi:integrase/recombinase XerD